MNQQINVVENYASLMPIKATWLRHDRKISAVTRVAVTRLQLENNEAPRGCLGARFGGDISRFVGDLSFEYSQKCRGRLRNFEQILESIKFSQ